MTERPPFDERDAATIARFLREHDLTAFDPFADANAAQDMIFTTSLAGIRAAMTESFATRRPSGEPFRGVPVFIERSSPNAFAVEVEGVQLIACHVGLVVSAFELASFLFAQESLFRDIGNPDGERSPTLPKGAALSFWIGDRLRAGMGSQAEPVGLELLPVDPQRQLASHFLTQLLVRFAWLHELFHVLNGHTGLMAQRRQGTALYEMPETVSSLVEPVPDEEDAFWTLTRHCLEFDADRTAVWAMVRMQQTDADPIVGLAALPRPQRLKLVLFAAMLMTFIFDQAARKEVLPHPGSHPLAYHRLHDLVRTVASNLLDEDGLLKASFIEMLSEWRQASGRVPELVSVDRLLGDSRFVQLQHAFNRVETSLSTLRVDVAHLCFHREILAEAQSRTEMPQLY